MKCFTELKNLLRRETSNAKNNIYIYTIIYQVGCFVSFQVRGRLCTPSQVVSYLYPDDAGRCCVPRCSWWRWSGFGINCSSFFFSGNFISKSSKVSVTGLMYYSQLIKLTVAKNLYYLCSCVYAIHFF